MRNCFMSGSDGNGQGTAIQFPMRPLVTSRYNNAVSLQPSDSIAARAALEGMPGISGFEHEERDARLFVFAQGKARLSEPVAERLRQRGVAFTDLRIERGRLDEVFRRITTPEASS